MKRMILFALLLNAALLGVATLQLVAIAGQEEAPVASENGDTNGDGVRDMSDAIHMLSWLFNGGPEPVPVACAQEGPALTAEQAEILSHMSLVYLPITNGDEGSLKTIRMTGVNLQVVNGLGYTWGDQDVTIQNDEAHRTNGLGNVIIGYQETRSDDGVQDTDDSNDRNGSHNLVVGTRNNYTAWGCKVVGARNTVRGWLSSIGGGFGNDAIADAVTISGGQYNLAAAKYTSIGGGWGNMAMNRGATIPGGGGNIAEGEWATVGGGRNNNAAGYFSVVAGGVRNTVVDWYGALLGGDGGW